MSALVLKLLAVGAMLADHIGALFFPDCSLFRIVGRVAFPVFAFFVAEGFRYTHDRTKYFFRMFLSGLVCQTVLFVAAREEYFCIFMTFSMSIAVMSCVGLLKRTVRGDDGGAVVLYRPKKPVRIVLFSLLCAAVIAFVLLICTYITVDYGFIGVMLPVLLSLSDEKKPRLLLLTLGLILLSFVYVRSFPIQFFSLLSVPLIALYNGKTGKRRLKWFFYIFYPAHLAALYLIKIHIVR